MTPEQLIAAGFIEGRPDRPRLGFNYACCVIADGLKQKDIDALKTRGYTHFELAPLGSIAAYSFCRTPDLETRLREHVEAYFPKS